MAPLIQSITSLFQRAAETDHVIITSIPSLVERSAPSSAIAVTIYRRANKDTQDYHPGAGGRRPDAFNRDLFLVLFSLIAAIMVLTALYFFLIAKNGGFVWKSTDWDDYKSTVLRRTGPDGKTVSNATKSTKLGGGSIAPTWDDDYTDVTTSSAKHSETGKQKHAGRTRQHYRDNKQDPVFNDYVHEKPAAIGGYNKPEEGSRYLGSNTDLSSFSTANKASSKKKERKEQQRVDKKDRRKSARQETENYNSRKDKPTLVEEDQPPLPLSTHKPPPSTVSHSHSRHESSYTIPASHVYGGALLSQSGSQSYYRSYRPGAPTMRAVPDDKASQSASHSTSNRRSASGAPSARTSPRKHHCDTICAREQESSSYTGTGSEVGTKVYPCHIPGISKYSDQPSLQACDDVRPDESVSQVGVSYPPRRSGISAFRRGR